MKYLIETLSGIVQAAGSLVALILFVLVLMTIPVLIALLFV